MSGTTSGPAEVLSHSGASAREGLLRAVAELNGTTLVTTSGGPHTTSSATLAAKIAARHLPADLLEALHSFRVDGNDDGYLLLSGLPLDGQLPPTPGGQAPMSPLPVSNAVLHTVLGVLGDPIAYADEHGGALIQDVCPVAGSEAVQGGSGTVVFEFHTENGFHPLRPDFIGLLTLRADHEAVARTIVGSIRRALPLLSVRDKAILRRPLFNTRLAASFGDGATQRYSLPYPVLSGDPVAPELTVDFYAMESLTDEAAGALARLKDALLAVTEHIRTRPGDLLVIDNRSAVHGRTEFVARHDGDDRWLRRLFVRGDVRRFQPARRGAPHVIASLEHVESELCRTVSELADAFAAATSPVHTDQREPELTMSDEAPNGFDIGDWPVDRLRAHITARPPNVDQSVRYYVSDEDPLRRDRSTSYLDLASLAEYEREPSVALLSKLVAQRSWFHTIELPGGLVTRGLYDHRPLVRDYVLPADLSGQQVLDVATYDGFWAFEFERRGGDVTAVDLPTRLERDWPAPVREALRAHDLDGQLGTGFRLARQALDSRVLLEERNVYTLGELGQKFDFVHVADLLVHLERPLEALRQIRAVTRGTAHIVEQFSPKLDPGSHTMAYYGGWSYTTWFVPSLSALIQLCYDAGFTDVELAGVHTLQPNADVAGQPRAILRAR